MNHGLKAYDKYSVKEGRDGYLQENKDGSPVLFEKVNEVMLDESSIKLLNNNWRNFKFYFVEKGVKEQKVETPKETEVIVARVEIPQPKSAEELRKDIDLDKLKAMTPEEVSTVLTIMSKADMLKMVGIELNKSKMTITNHTACIAMVKQKLAELKN